MSKVCAGDRVPVAVRGSRSAFRRFVVDRICAGSTPFRRATKWIGSASFNISADRFSNSGICIEGRWRGSAPVTHPLHGHYDRYQTGREIVMFRSLGFLALLSSVILATEAPQRVVAQGVCINSVEDPNVAYASKGITLLGQISLQEFGDTRASDMWGYVSPTGREYALIGLQNSFSFVEVTDPANPVIVEQIIGPESCWRDIKVYRDYAYGVADSTGEGIYIYDLTGIDDGVVTLATISQVDGFGDSHNIAVNTDSGFLYPGISNITPFGWGLVAIDLNDPLNPQLTGEPWFDGGIRVHDAQIVTYTEGPYAGREIAFCFTERPSSGDAIWIVDVTDKFNMFTVASVDYPTAAYSHQGWLSDDRRYLFADDELDEVDGLVPTTTTYVIDVQDLDNPKLVKTFTNGNTSSDHNLMVRGALLYEANYASGLRVFNISSIDDITEVGFFDTYPENDDAAAGSDGTGAWQVYTQMPSGIVLVSDRNRGLFIFDASELECGDGVVESGEVCDTGIAAGDPGACPTACDNPAACTVEELANGGTCLAQCNVVDNITEPANDDGCCPSGANANNDNDCPPVCGNDICEPTENETNCPADCDAVCDNALCEPSEDPIICPADCPCADASECDDGDFCTYDQCIASACSIVDNLYGDTNHDGTVDLSDILCVLDGFAGDFVNCSFADVDIAECTGNGTIDLQDILAVLDAFSGASACCSG